MRITEANNSEASKHGCAGISTFAHLIQASQCLKDIVRIYTELSSLLELRGKDIEEELRVGIGVDMPVGIMIKVIPELVGVDEISVLGLLDRTHGVKEKHTYMSKANAIRRIDIEWLRLRVRRRTSRGVSH